MDRRSGEKVSMKPESNNLTRRSFIGTVAGAAALGQIGSMNVGAEGLETTRRPLVVSTWPFGKPANEEALRVFDKTKSALDAVEQGIWIAETNNASVGLSGIPNAAGVVQLDACIMYGPGHKGGSVAAIEGIVHPISAARRVMEKTPHVMLVGAGAREFAIAEGLEQGKPVTDGQREAWQKWKAEKDAKTKGHDTISLLVLGPDGTIAGGCSTSGLAYKLPGRVGDSPILGSGLYVDNDVGAAGATGIGENVMRYCGSFLVVEYMRQGLHPQEACVKTIERIAKMDPKGYDLSINFVALDKKGRYGAAGTGKDFPYSVTYPGYSEVLHGASVTQAPLGAIGGNIPKQK
jgi:isoaspartyl peptidase/L-asparaginase-like protein (Ntn-hydrolase superfamily)